MKHASPPPRPRPSLVALLALGLLAHCADLRHINVDDYNQSCTEDADCIAISAGDVCDDACPNVAINKADRAQYEVDLDEIECEYGYGVWPTSSWDKGNYEVAPGYCDVEAFCNKSRCDVRLATKR